MRIRQAHIADAAAIARVHVESWRTAYAGLIPANYLAALSYEGREESWRRILSLPAPEQFDLVAENEAGEIIGFADGGPERKNDPLYRGELYAIYLLEQYQGQGIGRQLVQTVAGQLLARRFPSMLVWVLRDNQPARNFYQALGGQLLDGYTKETVIAQKKLIEVAYGWQDITMLVKP